MWTPLRFNPGIYTDDTPLSAEGFFVDADKIRFVRGKPQTIGGWEKASDSQFDGICRGLFAWKDLDGDKHLAVGTNEKLYAFDGTALTDITPATNFTAGDVHASGAGYGSGAYGSGGYGSSSGSNSFPLTWSFSGWGENLLANPRGQGLFEWMLSATANQISQAPQTIDAFCVTPERIVFVGGCSEPGGTSNYDPMRLRWSDSEDNTSWTPTSSNLAGGEPLEGGSRIVRVLNGNGEVLIWTDTALHRAVFTGDPQTVFTISMVADNCGLVGPNAVVVSEGVAYWMAPSGATYRYVGGGVQPIQSTVRRSVYDNMAFFQQEKIYAFAGAGWREVGWLYPDQRDGIENSRYVLLNTVDGVWTVGTFDRTAWIDAGLFEYAIAASSDGYLYFQEKGLMSADGSAARAYLKSGAIDLNEGQTIIQLQGFIPDFEDQTGGVDLTVGTRFWPNGDLSQSGPHGITANTNKVDFMISGRQFEVELESNDAPLFWRLGACRIFVTDTGATE